jgi:hypothetical protein
MEVGLQGRRAERRGRLEGWGGDVRKTGDTYEKKGDLGTKRVTAEEMNNNMSFPDTLLYRQIHQ